MELEKQVCSLDLSKRLQELGIKPDVQMYWTQIPTGSGKDAPYIWIVLPIDSMYEINSEEIPAFSVAELGEMLPERTDEYRKNYIKFQKIKCESTNNDHYLCSLVEDGGYNMDIVKFDCSDPNEANARALMLIHLIENKIITIKEIDNG